MSAANWHTGVCVLGYLQTIYFDLRQCANFLQIAPRSVLRCLTCKCPTGFTMLSRDPYFFVEADGDFNQNLINRFLKLLQSACPPLRDDDFECTRRQLGIWRGVHEHLMRRPFSFMRPPAVELSAVIGVKSC